MTNDANGATKKLELRNGLLIAVITSVLTLAGVMSTGLTSWISSSQSSATTKSQACIVRLDTQEQNFRGKADQFLVALGGFSALLAHKKLDNEAYNTRLDDLMKAGYSFSAYAPEKLATLSRNLVTQLKNAIHLEDESESKQALQDFYKSNQQWNDDFQQSLKELASDRSGC
ncbi:hypothetical protein [Pseudomonas sp. PB3P13]